MYRFMKQFVIYLWHIDFFPVWFGGMYHAIPMEIIDKSFVCSNKIAVYKWENFGNWGNRTEWPELNCWLIVCVSYSMNLNRFRWREKSTKVLARSYTNSHQLTTSTKKTLLWQYDGFFRFFFNESHKNNNISYSLKYISNELEVMASIFFFFLI